MIGETGGDYRHREQAHREEESATSFQPSSRWDSVPGEAVVTKREFMGAATFLYFFCTQLCETGSQWMKLIPSIWVNLAAEFQEKELSLILCLNQKCFKETLGAPSCVEHARGSGDLIIILAFQDCYSDEILIKITLIWLAKCDFCSGQFRRGVCLASGVDCILVKPRRDRNAAWRKDYIRMRIVPIPFKECPI